MLKIVVPSSEGSNLSFSAFEKYELPAPLSGVDAEVNNDAILKFEDEKEAIVYAAQLENMAEEINDKTTIEYRAINDIIVAIRSDEFVQNYTL